MNELLTWNMLWICLNPSLPSESSPPAPGKGTGTVCTVLPFTLFESSLLPSSFSSRKKQMHLTDDLPVDTKCIWVVGSLKIWYFHDCWGNSTLFLPQTSTILCPFRSNLNSKFFDISSSTSWITAANDFPSPGRPRDSYSAARSFRISPFVLLRVGRTLGYGSGDPVIQITWVDNYYCVGARLLYPSYIYIYMYIGFLSRKVLGIQLDGQWKTNPSWNNNYAGSSFLAGRFPGGWRK